MKKYFGRFKMIERVLIFIVALLFSGCAVTRAPWGWHEQNSNINYNAWGGWIYLRVIPDEAKSIDDYDNNFQNVDLKAGGGEFITFQDSLVYILFENKLIKVPYYRIYRAELEIGKTNKVWFALWTFLGIVSTGSHGLVSVISAPIWLLSGTVSTISESYRNRFVLKHIDYDWWLNAKKFSRFPQGLSADFDLSQLKSKTVD